MPNHETRVRRNYEGERIAEQWRKADAAMYGPRCVCGAYRNEAHAPECYTLKKDR